MAEALKLSRWSIADALEALEAQGVIERQQTKKGASARYLVMPSVPIVAGVPLPVVVPIPTELAREWTGSGQVVAGVPLPERERETENPPSNFSQSDQAGKKGRAKELVRACVEQDLSNRPPAEPVGDALKRKLAKTYEPIVSAALEEYPGATGSDLVSYCVTKRRGEPVSRALVTALKGNQAQECQQCNGGGVTFETAPDSEGVSRTRVVPCSSCT
jgi:hypothetical protein